jgi:hypothetical protein
VVMLLNDWTSREPDQILAELQGSETKAGSAESMKMPGGTGQSMPSMPGMAIETATSPAESEKPTRAMQGMAMGERRPARVRWTSLTSSTMHC